MSPHDEQLIRGHMTELASLRTGLDSVAEDVDDTRSTVATVEHRLTVLETEWRSSARLFAQYVVPVLLIVAAEVIRLFVFKR